MKCYTVDGRGIETLKAAERPDPAPPGPGMVLVDVHAVSLNYRDLMVADGRYGGVLEEPIIAASDMAGVVRAVGPGVRALEPGERVLNAPFRSWPAGTLRSDWARTFVGGAGVDGVLAEQVIYPAASLVRVPEHLSLVEGSTLTVAGLTAWAAVVTHGRVRAGDWVLVHGTGGVSIFGAQIARLFGARVILSTSSEAKAALVKERLGVDATIDYRQSDWPKEVRRITSGRGADVVVEVVGGDSLSRSLKACAYGARVGVIGVLGGATSRLNVVDLLHHQVTVRGIYMESAEELEALSRAVESGRLQPVVDKVFPFEDARGAYRHLESQRHIGKVVIAVEAGA